MINTAISSMTINYDTSTITALLTTGETLSVSITYIPLTGDDETEAKSNTRGSLCTVALLTDLSRTFESLGSRVSLP
jgi:hypothetical protein